MDNLRRLFLSKDEVRSLGIELTNLTTDDIQALYLPLDRLLLIDNAGIIFDYRTKDHKDVNTAVYTKSGSTEYSCKINNTYNTPPITLGSSDLRFIYNLVASSTNILRNCTFMYNSICNYTNINPPNSGNANSYVFVPVSDYMDVTDMYIKIDITKIKMRLVGNGTFTDFLIKYRSGNIPADTIFYEPYED